MRACHPGAQPIQHEAQRRARVVEPPADVVGAPRAAQALGRPRGRLARRRPWPRSWPCLPSSRARSRRRARPRPARHPLPADLERGGGPSGSLVRSAAPSSARASASSSASRRAEVVRILEGIRVARHLVRPERRVAGQPEDVKHLLHDGEHRAARPAAPASAITVAVRTPPISRVELPATAGCRPFAMSTPGRPGIGRELRRRDGCRSRIVFSPSNRATRNGGWDRSPATGRAPRPRRARGRTRRRLPRASWMRARFPAGPAPSGRSGRAAQGADARHADERRSRARSRGRS